MAALERAGGNRSEAALTLNIGRTGLHAFINEHPEIAEGLAAIDQDARHADMLARRLRRGDIHPDDRRALRRIFDRVLTTEARAA
jgi:hypothetical protein